MSHITKEEQAILDAFNSGKGVGYAEGMQAFKPRELSDEEIMKEWHSIYSDTYEDVLIEFARAILKKAREK
jgi:hypothetical protein